MKKRITFSEFLKKRPLLETGDVLEVLDEEGKILVTIEPHEIPPNVVEYPFRGIDFGPRPENLTTDPAQIVIDEREYERSGKKHGF